MIDFDEALSAVLASATPLPSTRVALEDALGYVLSKPEATPHNLPLFDNSAVDGFGVRVGDTAGASDGSPARLELEKNLLIGYTGKSRLSGDIHQNVTEAWKAGDSNTVDAISQRRDWKYLL